MEDRSQLRQEIARLKAVYQAVVDGLLQAKPFRVGSVVRRFPVCGKAGCRCQRGEKRGPFWYVSEKEAGRTRLRYLGTDAKARKELAAVENYRQWRRLRLRLRRVQRETEMMLDRVGVVLAATEAGGV